MVDSRRRGGVRRAAIVACLLAVLAGAVVPGAAAAGTTDRAGSAAAGHAAGATGTAAVDGHGGAAIEAALGLPQEVDADRTRISIALQPDGDARWRLELRTDLAENGSREAFESLQADVRNDGTNLTETFRERMAGSAAVASDATGREMAIRNLTVTARIDGLANDGVLAYEFEWTSFAAVDGERLRAGDAIDRFFFESGTRLTIRWPDGYRATSVRPGAAEHRPTHVTWRGSETDFSRGEPRVVVAPDAGRSWLAPAVGGVAGLLVLAGLAWLVRSGRLSIPTDRLPGGSAPEAESGAAAAAAGGSGGGATAGGGAGGAGGPSPESEDSSTGSGDGGPDAGGTGDEIPRELLSNEEQVVRLLEANGGRMKQQQVVSELGWTEAKTSQVVTSMHDDEQLEKFRIGRENVLALLGEADL